MKKIAYKVLMIFQFVGIFFLLSALDINKLLAKLFFKEVSVCMVVSEQEDAQIFINGKDSKKRTPSLIKIPQNTEVKLVLKKEGFQDHQAVIKSRHELTFYHCRLAKFELKLITPEI